MIQVDAREPSKMARKNEIPTAKQMRAIQMFAMLSTHVVVF